MKNWSSNSSWDLETLMFERYTEQARRVVFFARYATSELGAECIETEHLLLGLLREDKSLVTRFLVPGDSIDAVRHHIEKETIRSDKRIPMSVDLPLSDECKQVLAYAAEESEKLFHHEIGTVHLLLGFFRVENCLAARILLEHGVNPSIINREFRSENSVNSVRPQNGFVPDAETAMRIAEAVWIPIFGQKEVESQRPFQVDLEYHIWIVTGSPKEGSEGAALLAKISKADGAILRVGQAK
jgi:ATP-dependent Clp protease ATP-binding subunit ClpA